MQKSRRTLLIATATGAVSALAGPLLLEALQKSPQPLQSPNAPTNQNFPTGLGGPEVTSSKRQATPLRQEQIAASVQQLFRLASELKDEIDRSNLQTTFSLSVVKKAQQIEKLAKQIKEQAKG